MAVKSKGRRLTQAAKKAIETAPADTTNTALAEKYDTTLQTIARYRGAKSTRGGRGARLVTGLKRSAGGIEMQLDGDYIVLRIPKKGILKGLVGDLFN